MNAGQTRMSRLIKSGMYLLSLWLLFLLIIVNKIDIDICMECKFATKAELFEIASKNYLPLLCLLMLAISLCFYFAFARIIKGAKDGPFKIIEIEDKSAEHLVFLATYVIPLVGFSLENTRQIINLSITLVLLGAIYIRTNLFYANPTLSLLGFKIYTVKIEQGGVQPQTGSAILISHDELELNGAINALKLDKHIFFARKAIAVSP